jgi:hypothetical protein
MSLLPANLLVMLLLWNNIRFQNEPPNPNQLTKEPVPRDLIEDGISNGKCASSEGWHEQWVKVPPG